MNRTVAVAVGALVLAWIAYMLFRTKPATAADVDVAVSRALISERDPSVLRAFAKKLDAAGRTTQALELSSRADALASFSGGSQTVISKALQPPAPSQGSQTLARF